MKRFWVLNIILGVFLSFNLLVIADSSFAASKSKGMSEEDLQKLEENVDGLVKKIYASSLFSPEDAEKLVDIRLKLDSLMASKDAKYARLFYDAGYICNQREYKEEAADYFRIVSENFPNSIYAKKALNELKQMGIKLESEEEEDDS